MLVIEPTYSVPLFEVQMGSNFIMTLLHVFYDIISLIKRVCNSSHAQLDPHIEVLN